jgi:hypothetical protein
MRPHSFQHIKWLSMYHTLTPQRFLFVTVLFTFQSCTWYAISWYFAVHTLLRCILCCGAYSVAVHTLLQSMPLELSGYTVPGLIYLWLPQFSAVKRRFWSFLLWVLQRRKSSIYVSPLPSAPCDFWHANIRTCIYVCMYIRMYVCARTCIHTPSHTDIHICIRINAHKHINTYN